MHNRHERVTCATPEQLVALVSDFDAIWPKSLAPPPRRLETGLYEVPPMRWQEIARPGAIRAFHVTWPEELDAQHWFELQTVDKATVLRHIIDGRAFGAYMAIWTEKIEPRHDLILEALFDTVELSSTLNRRSRRRRSAADTSRSWPSGSAGRLDSPPRSARISGRSHETTRNCP